MKVITYMCEKCLEPHIFDPSQNNEYFFCPTCGGKMMYWCTEEIDPVNNNVVNRYEEPERKQKNPGKPICSKSMIKCPYCHSTNTKKISALSKAGSVVLWGIFALGKTSKQWHCNNCNSDF